MSEEEEDVETLEVAQRLNLWRYISSMQPELKRSDMDYAHARSGDPLRRLAQHTT